MVPGPKGHCGGGELGIELDGTTGVFHAGYCHIASGLKGHCGGDELGIGIFNAGSTITLYEIT